MNVGDDVDFSTYPNGVHVAAQVLYNFIRSLPSAILPMEQCSIVHSAFIVSLLFPESPLQELICILGRYLGE